MIEIPGYTIEREIGYGGMATVYLAVQESLGRKVALKVMSAALAADRTFTERFLKEARTIAQLSHPHIVAIHDLGVLNHHHFLSLEYINGGDLKARIRHGAIPPSVALDIVREMAAALGYGHAKGIVHRDVKPENILFREGGMAVLTDFGIARGAGSGTRMTEQGMSIGTPHYMSPEQARGKAVDGRADIYALGIVLYEMLTGKVPYDAEETLAIGIMHVTDPVPELPASLAGYQPLLDRMLAKNPNDRFRTTEGLMAAIDSHYPTAKPRNSGPRRTVVMPTLLHDEKTTPEATPRRSSGVIWARVCLFVAVAVLGGVYVANYGYQNRAMVEFGGRNLPPPVSKSPERTPLDEAINKPVPVAVVVPAPQPDKPAIVTISRPSPVTEKPKKSIEPVTEPDMVKLELAAWTSAQGANTRSSYQLYIDTYPNGTFAALARTRMSKIANASLESEVESWKMAEQANKRESYEKFLSVYPNGTYAVLARARIKKME